MNILDRIVIHKKEEIELDKANVPLQLLQDLIVRGISPVRHFFEHINDSSCISLITELKFASPSRGTINQRENLKRIIQTYEMSGASAISVLTEQKYFQGHSDDIRRVKQISGLPVLRKDFILDEYQIYQSRCLGADAILLISSILENSLMSSFQEIAFSLGMDCLIEVHNEKELEQVLEINPKMIGINNRNLEDFQVDLSTTERLSSLVPDDCLLISESGIKRRVDLEKLSLSGIAGILVGEALMAHPEPEKLLREFLGVQRKKRGSQ